MIFNTGKFITAALLATMLTVPAVTSAAMNDTHHSGAFLADNEKQFHKKDKWQKGKDRPGKFGHEDERIGKRPDFNKRGDRRGPGDNRFNSRNGQDRHFMDEPGKNQMHRPQSKPEFRNPRPDGSGFHGQPDGHNPMPQPGNMRPNNPGFPGNQPGHAPMPPEGMHPGARGGR